MARIIHISEHAHEHYCSLISSEVVHFVFSVVRQWALGWTLAYSFGILGPRILG